MKILIEGKVTIELTGKEAELKAVEQLIGARYVTRVEAGTVDDAVLKAYLSGADSYELPRPTDLKCQRCGCEITGNERMGRKRKCCSECAIEAKAERTRAWKEARGVTVKNTPAVCLHCGKEFIRRHGLQKYCSDECCVAHKKNSQQRYFAAYYAENREHINARRRKKQKK